MSWLTKELIKHRENTDNPIFFTESDYFSHYIKTIRAENGLTQEQLANLLGTVSITISNWERKTNLPNDINLLAIQKIKRKLWMDKNWIDIFDCNKNSVIVTPGTIAVKTLLMNREDKEAQELGEYLKNISNEGLSEIQYVYLLLVTSLAYAIGSGQTSKVGEKLANEALSKANKLPKEKGSFVKEELTLAIKNEIIGYSFFRLSNTQDASERVKHAQMLISECTFLYTDSVRILNPIPVYLWNALEVATQEPGISDIVIANIVQSLFKAEDAKYVKKRINNNVIFKVAIPFLTLTSATQIH